MKSIKITLVLLILSSINVFSQSNDCAAIDLPKQEISETERASLLHMYEEEKLAGDVYISLYKKWNIRIFDNISQAEERHQSMVAALLDKYEIEYNANTAIGVFENTQLQKLYNKLIEQGNKSIENALTVGATIEDLDIYDIDEMLKNDVDNEDISIVYSNLRRGSTNHMRAFNRWLLKYGISYKAQYISTNLLNKIISK